MYYSIQFFRTILVTASLLLLLTACGGGNSSSEDSSAEVTVTTDSGATATFASDEITAGEVAELIYNLGGDQFTATIHWGDGTTSRIRGRGVARHRYGVASTYSIGLQIDGGSSERVGAIVVIEAPSRPNSSSSTPSTPGSQFSFYTGSTQVQGLCGGVVYSIMDAGGNVVNEVELTFLQDSFYFLIVRDSTTMTPIDSEFVSCMMGQTALLNASDGRPFIRYSSDGTNITLTLQ